jgi:1-deoxy-D-xylulose-5-phosphate synthase
VCGDALDAAAAVESAGYTVRVADPRWVTPVDPVLFELAARADLVVTVEDGVTAGGAGSRIVQALRETGIDVPARQIGIPTTFLAHGSVADVRAAVGLTPQDIGRRIVEWSALVLRSSEPDTGVPAARRSGELGGP